MEVPEGRPGIRPQQVLPFFQTQDRGLEPTVLVDGSLFDARRRARALLRHLLNICVASVAAQSEAAMEKIAELYPDLKIILESRYVDDLAMSVMTVEEARHIMERTTSVLTAYQ